MQRMLKYGLWAWLLAALLSACQSEDRQPGALAQMPAPAKLERNLDIAAMARGGRLYQENCAQCHGKQAEGAPNWRQLDPDGMYPPPPLNGSGHAWHHPKPMLHYVIKNGSPGGKGKMPAWREKLSDAQIDDIITWFMSRWPEEVYQAWARRGAAAAQSG